MPFSHRHLNILDYALSLLFRRRVRSLMLVLVFSILICVFASFQLFSQALLRAASTILTQVPDITVQQLQAGRQVGIQVDPGYIEKEIFGIRSVRPRIWGYYFDEKNGANYTVLGLGEHGSGAMPPSLLQWGRYGNSSGEVVLAEPVRQNLQLGERKSFSLFRPDLSLKSFTTVGIFARETGLVTDDLLFVSLSDAADLFHMKPGEVTDLMIDVANPAEIDTIARKVAALLPGSRVVTKKQIEKTYRAIFGYRSGVGFVLLFGALLGFFVLAWDRISGQNVLEQREMAILKVCGWQVGDIMLVKVFESGLVAMLSLVLGYSLALFHLILADGALFRPLLFGWSVLRPSLPLDISLNATDVLIVSCCSVIPYMAASIVPTWKSAMVRTEEVL